MYQKNLEDPIATLMEVVATMSIEATLIPWDAIVFCRDNDLPLFIYKSDLMEIVYLFCNYG